MRKPVFERHSQSLVPVNLKDQDAFHLTIEEYLLALISLVEELVSSTTFDISFLPKVPYLLPLLHVVLPAQPLCSKKTPHQQPCYIITSPGPFLTNTNASLLVPVGG
jgi:hypothetical protein